MHTNVHVQYWYGNYILIAIDHDFTLKFMAFEANQLSINNVKIHNSFNDLLIYVVFILRQIKITCVV